jgi:hypothetical protein
MPVDDDLPPSLLSPGVESGQIVRHFPERFGVRVDLDGLDVLPPLERLSLAGARLPEPPEAVLLDRVLQLVPVALLEALDRIVIVQTRGTARYGGSRGRLVRVSAQEARARERDRRFTGSVSQFTTTVLHEVGHVVYEAVLSEAQREQVERDYLDVLDGLGDVPPGEPSVAGVQHYFIGFFVAAVLGHAEPPVSAGDARRYLDQLSLDLRPR